MQNKNNAGDRLGRRDVLFASAAGLVFTFVYLVFAAKGMDPALWRDLTVAAGIAPPQTIFPGVWRVVAHALLSFVGPGGIAFTLTVLGSIVGGLCVSLAYLIFRIVLAYLARVRNVPEWSPIASLFSLLAVASLGAGDAMMAALVWAHLRGENLSRAATLGAAAAAITIESEETISPALSAEAVLRRAL